MTTVSVPAKTVLGEPFLIPNGDHRLTVFDLSLNPSNIRRILGKFSSENVIISLLGGKQLSLEAIYRERKKIGEMRKK